MEPVPLEQIGLRLRDHRAALWWLAMLYRRPKTLVDSLKRLPRIKQVRVGFSLWLHALPYVLVLTAVARGDLLRLSGTPWSWAALGALKIVGGIAFGIALGITCGIAFGIA